MWNVLWVQQGQSFSAIDLPKSARSNVQSALGSEFGNLLGGRRGRALPQAIEKQLGELVTANNKPREKYKKVIEQIELLQDVLQSVHARREGLSEAFDELEAAQEKLARLSTGNRDQDGQNELGEARKRHTQLVELGARIQAANSDFELKKLNLEQAIQAQEDRLRLKGTIALEEGSREAAKKRLEEVDDQQKESRSRLDQLRAAVREAEAAVTKADEAVSRRRRVLSAVQTDVQIREFQTRYDKV
jgi:chromosome segregation ATPase